MKKYIVLAIITFMFPTILFAHPGRTDSSGCHTCRTNCPNWGLYAGEYHCHNAKTLPQPKEPIKSTYGESGTGYTTPEPKYKTPSSISPPISQPTSVEVTRIEKKSWFYNIFSWLFK